MNWWMFLYEEIKSFYNMYIFLLILCIGLFIWLADGRRLKKKKLNREARMCKWIGLVYIFGGVVVYIAVKIL